MYVASAAYATNAGTASTANSANTSTTATRAKELYSTDLRSVATNPNQYNNYLSFEGLKFNSTIGYPSGSTYSYIVGLRGWSDPSGGNSHEIAFNNDGIYVRQGGTSWGGWNKLATEAYVNSKVASAMKVNVYKYYTASTTFTVPNDVTQMTVAVTAGGGGGGGYYQYRTFLMGGGGGAGGYLSATYKVTPGEKLQFTVGAGGAGFRTWSENGTSGKNGYASSVPGITCSGGYGGKGYGSGGSIAGGAGSGCSTSGSRIISIVQKTPGKNGNPGAHYSYGTSYYTRGGASAHGAGTWGTNGTWGSGGNGGRGSCDGAANCYGGNGGSGLIQVWYSTDIKNIVVK